MFFCCVVCFVLSGISTTLFQFHLSHRWGVQKDNLLTPYRCYFEYRTGTTPTQFPGPSPVSCWILTSLLRKIMRMMWVSLGLGNDQGQLFAERGSSRGPLVPGEVFSMQDKAKRKGQGLGTAVFSRRILQSPEL